MTKRNDKTQASVCCWNFNNVWIGHPKLADSITFITKRQLLLMWPVSCFCCWPLPQRCCQAAHGGLLQIFIIVFCGHHFAIVVTVTPHGNSTQPLLCKPAPNPYSASLFQSPAFFCLNVAIAISADFSLCCLESIQTVIAAECMASLWVLLADTACWLFPFEFYFSLGHCLKCGRCCIVLCHDGNVPCLCSTSSYYTTI